MRNRWWSWFSSDEIAHTLTLLPCAFFIIAIIVGNLNLLIVLIVLAGIVLGYIFSALITVRHYRSKSEEMGLSYYYVVPIHIGLARLFVRKKRIDSPNVYKLHVNTRKMKQRKSLRASNRCMHNDVAMLCNEVWGSNPIFIGNTFADLGVKQREEIRTMADLVEYEGMMSPFYHFVTSKAKFARMQEQYYGRVYYVPDRIKWKIYVIRPRMKGERSFDYASN